MPLKRVEARVNAGLGRLTPRQVEKLAQILSTSERTKPVVASGQSLYKRRQRQVLMRRTSRARVRWGASSADRRVWYF